MKKNDDVPEGSPLKSKYLELDENTDEDTLNVTENYKGDKNINGEKEAGSSNEKSGSGVQCS